MAPVLACVPAETCERRCPSLPAKEAVLEKSGLQTGAIIFPMISGMPGEPRPKDSMVPPMDLRVWMRRRQQLVMSSGKGLTDPETDVFPVWELQAGSERLSHSYGCSEPPCGWDRKYANAQRVWAATPEGEGLRRGLQAECKCLFGGCDFQSSKVTSGDDLLRHLAHGGRHGLPQVFAFTVLSGGLLRFVEAAAGVAHAGMCEAAEAIWGAGEFWVMHQRGRYWLCVSNNSGTYKPTESVLGQMAAFFKDIVADDFEVEAILQDDSKVKEYMVSGFFKGDPVHVDDPRKPKAPEGKPASMVRAAPTPMDPMTAPSRAICSRQLVTTPMSLSSWNCVSQQGYSAASTSCTPRVSPSIAGASHMQQSMRSSAWHNQAFSGQVLVPRFTHSRCRSDPPIYS